MEPDVVVSDIHLPDGDGATFCMTHAHLHPRAKWILMSGNQDLVRQGNQLKSIAEMPAFAVADKPVPLRLLDRFIPSATQRASQSISGNRRPGSRATSPGV